MYSLDKAVELVLRWPAAKQKDRQQVIALLGELVRRCEEAMKVWSDYAASPGAPGDRFALVTWVGAARSKELHEINLRAKDHLRGLATLAGAPAARIADLDEDVIEMAYRSLKPDETGPQAAQASIAALKDRIQYLQALRTRVEKTPPAKAVASAKPAAKKAAPKKAGKKRAAAPKKAAKKKAAPKKK
jgi:hypothetical protein